jgi:hypothetical protein
MGGGGAAPGPGALGAALAVAEEYAGENAGANAGANAGGGAATPGGAPGGCAVRGGGGRCGAPPPIVGGRPASGGPDPSIARARSAI